MMKFFFLVLSLVLAFSPNSAQATTTIERLSPSDREAVGRMVSFALLEKASVHLTSFFATGDEKDLEPLLKSWSPADQAQMKRELKSLPQKPKLRVEGAVLFIGLKEGEVEFEVVDPFQGIFRLDGKQIRIRPLAQYKQFSEKFDELFEVSYQPHPIMSLVFPEAQAGVFTLAKKTAALIAAKVVKPTAAASGGYVRKEAASTGDAVGDEFLRAAREARQKPPLSKRMKDAAKSVGKSAVFWTSATVGGGLVAGTVFRCSALSSNEDITSLDCLNGIKNLPGRVLCDKNWKTEGCVTKASEMAPAPKIVPSDATPASTVVKPVNGNKCTETRDGTGFQKDVEVHHLEQDTLDTAAKKDLAISEVKPSKTQKIHLEYGKNEAKPEDLTYKSLVESVSRPNPENPKKPILMSQSFWVWKEKKWTMHIYENPASELVGLRDRRAQLLPRRIVECDESNLTKECEDAFVRVIGAVLKLKDCGVDNPAAVMQDIKDKGSQGVK